MSGRLYKYIAMSALIAATSCDEGRLYDKEVIVTGEGGNARVTATVTAADSWTEGYTLAVAGFEDGNEFALISKNIGTIDADGKCDVVLTGIPAEVSTVELCAIDRLRRRVATFASAPYAAGGDTVRITASETNLSMSAAIQQEIFNTTCTQCHGGSNYAAAGLHLTDGVSFAEMISVPSVKVNGKNRVEPGSSSQSVLFMILEGNTSAEWNYDHSVEVVRQEKLDLIRNWIDGGAKL
ncbi:MAG: hypothetical protein HDS51_03700 [Barnesiella sp.]|nr:hypothetical protein [Barnesiella sp.]